MSKVLIDTDILSEYLKGITEPSFSGEMLMRGSMFSSLFPA